MIYRIWDTETNQYVDGLIDSQGYVRFLGMGTLILVEDQNRYKKEWGFKIADKCFYEGDIIEYANMKYIVSFEQTQFRVYPKGMFKMHSGSAIAYGRVIGNVNQNPELLEAK